MSWILQFCAVLLLFLGLETRAWARPYVAEKAQYGGFAALRPTRAGFEPSRSPMNTGEAGHWRLKLAPDVCDGPNLYTFVRQNPWTSWDPFGLQETAYTRRLDRQLETVEGAMQAHEESRTLAPIYVGGSVAMATGVMAVPLLEAAGFTAGFQGFGAFVGSGITGDLAMQGVEFSTAGRTEFDPSRTATSGLLSAGLWGAGAGVSAAVTRATAAAIPAESAAAARVAAAVETSTSEVTAATAATGRNVTTPNTAMRANANLRPTYIDPENGNLAPASGNLAADHIVPKSWIKALPGFSELTPQQQSWLLNHPLNTQGLPKTFNSSKGAKMPGEWRTYKGRSLDPGYIQNDAERAQFLQKFMQRQIKDMKGPG